MGISERKEKEKEIKRNDIIDAAEKVFFSKGYDLATMDDVAKEAEFSKRTLYVYFNSKEQIYFEIMVRGYKLLIDMIESSLNESGEANFLERIRLIGKIMYKFNTIYPNHFFAIMSYENSEMDFAVGIPDQSREECYTLGEKLFGYLTDALEKGVKGGEIQSEIDIKSTAIIIWSCTVGLFNTVIRKRHYIENYHNKNSEKLLLEGLDFIIKSIELKENEND
ncbi:MAG: TetR/AcrR family transcriptional regulator [Bacillota bacterium]|nr:TetR/AcrR family transcriptional regulator [Bacillota bacterium]